MSALDKISKLLDLFGGNQSAYGIPFANRNCIVDGNFDSWSTSTSVALPTGVSTYTGAVMYRATAGAGGAGSTSYNSFAAGTLPAGMDSRGLQYITHNQTTGSSGTVAAGTAPSLYQNVENVSTFAGQSSTFSLWLWTNSGTLNISNIFAGQYFGAGGSPSPGVALNVPVNWTVTTTPQRFSVQINWPALVGKTIGTTGGFSNSALQIGLWLPPGQTFNLNTTQWQLEQSSPQAPAAGLPTAFEYRGQQAELARVQRYWEAVDTAGISLAACNATTNIFGATYPFKVQKRAIPTMIGSGSAFSVQPQAIALTALSYASTTQNSCVISATSAGGFTIGSSYQINGYTGLTADARL